MPLAATSNEVLVILKETAFGVAPVTGNPLTVRMTGETLKFNISKEASKEINKSRTINSMIPVSANANGAINSEVFYGAQLDQFFASALQSTWAMFGTNGIGVSTPGGFSATAFTATAATTGANAFTTLARGQWFRVVSPGPNNGKILRVHPTTAPTPTVLTLDPATPATVAASEAVVLQSRRLTHGSLQDSYAIERQNPDINSFITYLGMTISKFSLTIAKGALSGMVVEFMGKNGIDSATTNLPGTPTAAATTDIHSGVAGATLAVWMDGAPIAGTFATNIALDYDNALRAQEAIGTLGSIGIGNGTIALTVKATLYFADRNMFTKFRNNTDTSLIFASTDSAGNGYIFTLPRANITDWTSNASAKDQDQMVELTLTALSDDNNAVAELRKAFFIDKVGV